MKIPAAVAQRDWSRLVDAGVLVVVLAVAWLLGVVLVGLVRVADELVTLIMSPAPDVAGAALAAWWIGGLVLLVTWIWLVYRFAKWVWPKRLEVRA